ncbi:helix-turn-helix domain-containing protein [Corynebacterium glucuronolyticum]|uniref:helix-turn-helix domain-containing protein n=1 Tax=Corynebacterium glucuronolyticum TaxID=39791 RepID=UPI00223C28B8|nr:helix-turn-helix transcriptional regulator [Corynebacterium glucuronolyticum]MCT1442237.1 helix-turn-helix domain-containing protein [Corynebacterium glucuronolyticum]
MARKEITVNQVADAIGMPISTLRRSVKGQRPFTIDELDSVAGYLGFTLSELLGMSENAA